MTKTNRLPQSFTNAQEINLIGPLDIQENIESSDLPTLIVDGGMNHGLNFPNSISIGDGDSSKLSLDIELSTEKDQSDLACALELILNQVESCKKVNLYGFLGQRKDHELIVIGEAYEFVRKSSALLIFDKSLKIIPPKPYTFEINGLFSIMSLQECLFSIQGSAKYQVWPAKKLGVLSSLGLSNEGSGEVTITSDTPLILYSEE
ncbi:hypothetical protein BIY24_09715 [Halobacteriovorax marinus]|uniref:hypothetical protein n=1 Tax=Halobacteriovorax marinus TaxID=97084 RepID=UPI000BC33CD9|nr:hypothetical protein [Halobacteriovorax marinus]ATH08216.1 hypothetical protein BIY24_09715 [Halobacteriovorax marinus]